MFSALTTWYNRYVLSPSNAHILEQQTFTKRTFSVQTILVDTKNKAPCLRNCAKPPTRTDRFFHHIIDDFLSQTDRLLRHNIHIVLFEVILIRDDKHFELSKLCLPKPSNKCVNKPSWKCKRVWQLRAVSLAAFPFIFSLTVWLAMYKQIYTKTKIRWKIKGTSKTKTYNTSWNNKLKIINKIIENVVRKKYMKNKSEKQKNRKTETV